MSQQFRLLTTILSLIQICTYPHLFSLPDSVCGKSQYVTPLNMGMKTNVPYDIANLFNRTPIQGALSVVLALALNAILFFGVITSPFGYFFGIPSKKYVLGTNQNATISNRMDIAEEAISFTEFLPPKLSPIHLKPAPRHVSNVNKWFTVLGEMLDLDDKASFNWTNTTTTRGGNDSSTSSRRKLPDIIWKIFVDFVTKPSQSSTNPTTILDGMFSLMPQSGSVRSKSCDLLSVCLAHGALNRLPNWVIKIYHVFSGKLASMPSEFKSAILEGIGNEAECVPLYADSCSETPFSIVLKSYFNFLPKNALENVTRRKQAMYL